MTNAGTPNQMLRDVPSALLGRELVTVFLVLQIRAVRGFGIEPRATIDVLGAFFNPLNFEICCEPAPLSPVPLSVAPVAIRAILLLILGRTHPQQPSELAPVQH